MVKKGLYSILLLIALVSLSFAAPPTVDGVTVMATNIGGNYDIQFWLNFTNASATSSQCFYNNGGTITANTSIKGQNCTIDVANATSYNGIISVNDTTPEQGNFTINFTITNNSIQQNATTTSTEDIQYFFMNTTITRTAGGNFSYNISHVNITGAWSNTPLNFNGSIDSSVANSTSKVTSWKGDWISKGKLSGLVANWEMEETAEMLTHDAWGNNLGTYTGATQNNGTISGATWNSSCKYGNCLRFNGTTDYIDNIIFSNNLTTYTVSTWVKLLDNTSGNELSKLIASQSTSGFWFGFGSGENAQKIEWYNGTTTIISNTSVVLNDWVYITISASPSSSIIYLNGSPVTSTVTSSQNISSNVIFMIGGRADAHTSPWTFNGSIDSFRVWDSALNQTQISLEMNSSRPIVKPIGSWEFEEGTGTNAEDTNHIIAGKANNTLARGFDGVNDYISITGNASSCNSANNTMTVCAWFKTAEIGGGDYQAIVSQRSYPNTGWEIRLWNDDKFSFITDNGEDHIAQSTGIPTVNTWYHLCGVVNGTHNILYMDGVLNASVATGLACANTDITIGAYTGNQAWFNGTIDEVRIYNRSLSANEVLEIYQDSIYTQNTSGTQNASRNDFNGTYGWTASGNLPSGLNFSYNLSSNISVGGTCNTSSWITTNTGSIGKWCYQESTNVSNQTGIDGNCGLNYSGNFNYTDFDAADYSGAYCVDGSYGTNCQANSTNTSKTAYLYLNYSKPPNARSSSLWQIRYSGFPNPTINYSIPDDCWDQNPLQFMIYSRWIWTNSTCWDGNQWLQLDYKADTSVIFEESMYWDLGISPSSTYILNTSVYADCINDTAFSAYTVKGTPTENNQNITRSATWTSLWSANLASVAWNSTNDTSACWATNSTSGADTIATGGTNLSANVSGDCISNNSFGAWSALGQYNSTLQWFQRNNTITNLDTDYTWSSVVWNMSAPAYGMLASGQTNGTYTLAASAINIYANMSGDYITLKNLTGTVGVWDFDENNGTSAYDISGQNNTGTITGALWNSSCMNGNCLKFNGTTDDLNAGTTVLTTGATSISMWIKSSKSQSAGIGSFLAGGGGLILYQGATGITDSIMMGFRGNSEMSGPASGVTPGSWQHIVVVYDGGNKSLVASYNIYINGISQTVTKIAGTIGGSQTMNSIGSDQGGAFWNGSIDDVTIYNRSLSIAEIQDLYQSTLSQNTSGIQNASRNDFNGTQLFSASSNLPATLTFNYSLNATPMLVGTCTGMTWINGSNGTITGIQAGLWNISAISLYADCINNGAFASWGVNGTATESVTRINRSATWTSLWISNLLSVNWSTTNDTSACWTSQNITGLATISTGGSVLNAGMIGDCISEGTFGSWDVLGTPTESSQTIQKNNSITNLDTDYTWVGLTNWTTNETSACWATNQSSFTYTLAGSIINLFANATGDCVQQTDWSAFTVFGTPIQTNQNITKSRTITNLDTDYSFVGLINTTTNDTSTCWTGQTSLDFTYTLSGSIINQTINETGDCISEGVFSEFTVAVANETGQKIQRNNSVTLLDTDYTFNGVAWNSTNDTSTCWNAQEINSTYNLAGSVLSMFANVTGQCLSITQWSAWEQNTSVSANNTYIQIIKNRTVTNLEADYNFTALFNATTNNTASCLTNSTFVGQINMPSFNITYNSTNGTTITQWSNMFGDCVNETSVPTNRVQNTTLLDYMRNTTTWMYLSGNVTLQNLISNVNLSSVSYNWTDSNINTNFSQAVFNLTGVNITNGTTVPRIVQWRVNMTVNETGVAGLVWTPQPEARLLRITDDPYTRTAEIRFAYNFGTWANRYLYRCNETINACDPSDSSKWQSLTFTESGGEMLRTGDNMSNVTYLVVYKEGTPGAGPQGGGGGGGGGGGFGCFYNNPPCNEVNETCEYNNCILKNATTISLLPFSPTGFNVAGMFASDIKGMMSGIEAAFGGFISPPSSYTCTQLQIGTMKIDNDAFTSIHCKFGAFMSMQVDKKFPIAGIFALFIFPAAFVYLNNKKQDIKLLLVAWIGLSLYTLPILSNMLGFRM